MAADLVKERVTVMFLQRVLNRNTFFLGSLNGFPIYHGPSNFRRTICAVGSEPCHNDVGESSQFLSGC